MDSVSKKTPDSMSKNPMDITGLVLWLASGMLWMLPVGLAAGLAGYPLLGITRDESQARKRRDDTFRD